ncbi:hypothetical protein [Kosakonia oryziphila]|jgi:hypothetical protein|uniref:hypothetical protein n=1 Tax=Kosakonia oryziphila TaxID=1005667 RepID=UPI000B7FAC5A|nr:hypothetical protein [Kosakonia oryziphila]
MMTTDSHKFKNIASNYQNIVSIFVIANALYKKIPDIAPDRERRKSQEKANFNFKQKMCRSAAGIQSSD